MSTVRRVLAIALLAGLALFLGAGPAAAHNVLISSNPSDGSSAATAPSRVSLVFNLPVREGFTAVIVAGPDGLAYQQGDPLVDGSTVSVGLGPLGPAGRYEVRWRIVSDDGHPVSGTLGFTLTAPGTGTGAPLPSEVAAPTAAPAGSGSGGAPFWPWIAGGVVLVVAGVVVALRLGR